MRERTESLAAAEASDALKATRIAELEAAAIAAEAAAAAAAATIAGLEQRVGLIQASHEKLGGLTVELVAVGLAAAAEEAAAKLRARSDQDKETRRAGKWRPMWPSAYVPGVLGDPDRPSQATVRP